MIYFTYVQDELWSLVKGLAALTFQPKLQISRTLGKERPWRHHACHSISANHRQQLRHSCPWPGLSNSLLLFTSSSIIIIINIIIHLHPSSSPIIIIIIIHHHHHPTGTPEQPPTQINTIEMLCASVIVIHDHHHHHHHPSSSSSNGNTRTTTNTNQHNRNAMCIRHRHP